MWVIVGICLIVATCRCGRPSLATGFYAIADGNCVQPSWGGPIPFAYDANEVAGILLDVEEVTAGKYNRTARYCDPEGDPVTVELLVGPAGMQVTQDVDEQTWTIAGDVPVGVTAIIVRAIDDPENGDPNYVVVTVLVNAIPRPNLPPALE
jgi:hypothetical protein